MKMKQSTFLILTLFVIPVCIFSVLYGATHKKTNNSTRNTLIELTKEVKGKIVYDSENGMEYFIPESKYGNSTPISVVDINGNYVVRN